jgi:hypothetical protein
MEESSRSTRTSRRRAQAIGAGVIVVIVLAVFVGVSVLGRSVRTDPWVVGFASVDTAVVVLDSAQIRHDLATSPANATASLRLSCEVGRRDAARLLSHRLPSNTTLRRVYETALQDNWRLYVDCASVLAGGAKAGVVTARLEKDLSLLRRDEVRVNAVARTVSYAPVFTSLG